MMNFLTLGIFWVGRQTQLNHLARSYRSLSWIHLVFLFAVSTTPFSTTLAGLLGEHCAARRGLVLQLDVRDRHGPGERRHAATDVYRDQATHCDRAGAVRVRGAAVRDQHLCKYRVHRGRAA
jgi:hypothetical protein